jgi:hypothetical protein
MFANNGFTEVGWFQLNENCPPPLNIRAEATHRQMTIRWQPQAQHQSFVVQYRQKTSNDFFDWTSVESSGNELTINGLSPGWPYDYRVGAICGGIGFGMPGTQDPVFSNVREVRTKTLEEARAANTANCGVAAVTNITNFEPTEELQVGDVITAHNFPVTLTELTNLGSGWYSGKGWTTLGWIFEDVRFAMIFERIRVNTDNQLIDGFVEAERRANASSVFETGSNRPGTGQGSGITFETVILDFTVPEMPQIEYDPEKGELVVYDANNAPHIVQVPRNEAGEPIFPFQIESADGQRFQVDLPEDSLTNDGKIIPIVAMERGSVESGNTDISSEELETLRSTLVEELIRRIETKLSLTDFSGQKRRLIEGAINNTGYLRTNVTITTEGLEASSAIGWYEGLTGITYVRHIDNTEDMKSTIFHEYLHYINHSLKIFEYRRTPDTQNPYSKRDPCFFFREPTMDEILFDHFFMRNHHLIIEWPEEYNKLSDEQQKMVLDFLEQNPHLQKAGCLSGHYRPSNYLREEFTIHSIVDFLNHILFNMSEERRRQNKSSIEHYGGAIERAIQYEERNNLNEKGYEK